VAYATEEDVLSIMDTVLTQEQIAPFLRTASNLVAGSVVATGAAYSDETLADIEMWLAAHLACSRDPQLVSEKIGNWAGTYDGKSGLGLDSTRYGQQVKLIDYKGCLSGLENSKGTVEFEAMPDDE
jgi:hypothetical protein